MEGLVLFIFFLLENGALVKFFNKVDNDWATKVAEGEYYPDDYILHAFEWADSGDGEMYWSKLHDEWLERLEKAGLY